MAYLAAGHHAGLPDWEADRTGQAAENGARHLRQNPTTNLSAAA